MTRTKFYIRIDIEHDTAAETQKLASEITRTIRKIYGVREVEISHSSSEEFQGDEDNL